jgi:hypothetical protein
MQHLCESQSARISGLLKQEYIKTNLALAFSRRMVWDIVVSEVTKSEEEVSQLPLGGLCLVLRAGLAVLQGRQFVVEEIVHEEEVKNFMATLTWFSQRWRVGTELLSILGGVLEKPQS